MQFDIGDPLQNNERVVKNAALLAGHVPGRAISATGTLKFSLKTNIDLDKEIPGGRVTFVNKIGIKNNKAYCVGKYNALQQKMVSCGFVFDADINKYRIPKEWLVFYFILLLYVV